MRLPIVVTMASISHVSPSTANPILHNASASASHAHCTASRSPWRTRPAIDQVSAQEPASADTDSHALSRPSRRPMRMRTTNAASGSPGINKSIIN